MLDSVRQYQKSAMEEMPRKQAESVLWIVFSIPDVYHPIIASEK